MAAEYDDLPEAVKVEVRAFTDVHVAADGGADAGALRQRARAIFAAIAGAQLMARSRADISVYDQIIQCYRAIGLIPA